MAVGISRLVARLLNFGISFLYAPKDEVGAREEAFALRDGKPGGTPFAIPEVQIGLGIPLPKF